MTFEADVFCTMGQIHNKSIVIIGGKSNVVMEYRYTVGGFERCALIILGLQFQSSKGNYNSIVSISVID